MCTFQLLQISSYCNTSGIKNNISNFPTWFLLLEFPLMEPLGLFTVSRTQSQAHRSPKRQLYLYTADSVCSFIGQTCSRSTQDSTCYRKCQVSWQQSSNTACNEGAGLTLLSSIEELTQPGRCEWWLVEFPLGGSILLNSNHLTNWNMFFFFYIVKRRNFVICERRWGKVYNVTPFFWHCWHKNCYYNQYSNIFYIMIFFSPRQLHPECLSVQKERRLRSSEWQQSVALSSFLWQENRVDSHTQKESAWIFPRHNASLRGQEDGLGLGLTPGPGFGQSFGRRAPTTGLSEQNSFHQPGRSITWWPCITVDHRFL